VPDQMDWGPRSCASRESNEMPEWAANFEILEMTVETWMESVKTLMGDLAGRGVRKP